MGVSIVPIVESVAVLLMKVLGGDVVDGGLCAIQLVGLRVSLVVYKEFVRCWNCSSQQLLLPLLKHSQQHLLINPLCFKDVSTTGRISHLDH